MSGMGYAKKFHFGFVGMLYFYWLILLQKYKVGKSTTALKKK